VGQTFRVSEVADQAQEIVEALRDVLEGAVALYDGETGKHHVPWSTKDWLSVETTTREEPRMRHLEARVNDRWTLYFCSQRALHADAESIMRWAADKLALYFPRRTGDGIASPSGGGASGGPAAAGIPVWWARKTRAN
jgi:hypothetical protein